MTCHWIIWTEPNGRSFSGVRDGYTAEQLARVLNHPSFRTLRVTVTTNGDVGRRAWYRLNGDGPRMKNQEIIDTIAACGGTVSHGIYWDWAEFPTEEACRAAFLMVQEHVEHRGICPPYGVNNWSFRFR